MDAKLHYHVGGGSYGCLFDFGPETVDSVDAAVETLAGVYGFGRDKRRELKRNFRLDLDPKRYGAQYCEISPCVEADCEGEGEGE